jgi:hypothetical protein
LSRLQRVIQRRRQLRLPPFDVHYRRAFVGAIGSKLVGVAPIWASGRPSDWLPPRLSRVLGRALLQLGDGLLVRSRPLYSIDRRTWYTSSEWQRRFETDLPEDSPAEARQVEFDDVGEALADAEALAASIGWRVTHLGRYAPTADVSWEAGARPITDDVDDHLHSAGATPLQALEGLTNQLRSREDERGAEPAKGANRPSAPLRPSETDIVEHVGALVLQVMSAESARQHSAGVEASASMSRGGAETTVELVVSGDITGGFPTLLVELGTADDQALIEVRTVDDEGIVIASIGVATVASIDLPQVALALTRAGITRLREVIPPPS